MVNACVSVKHHIMVNTCVSVNFNVNVSMCSFVNASVFVPTSFHQHWPSMQQQQQLMMYF